MGRRDQSPHLLQLPGSHDLVFVDDMEKVMPPTPSITPEAVEAACEALWINFRYTSLNWRDIQSKNMRRALTAALPFLTPSGPPVGHTEALKEAEAALEPFAIDAISDQSIPDDSCAIHNLPTNGDLRAASRAIATIRKALGEEEAG